MIDNFETRVDDPPSSVVELDQSCSPSLTHGPCYSLQEGLGFCYIPQKVPAGELVGAKTLIGIGGGGPAPLTRFTPKSKLTQDVGTSELLCVCKPPLTSSMRRLSDILFERLVLEYGIVAAASCPR